ncbi:BTAD domain-containing putative transcriptional regulator [Streptomyces sp. URMC 129]|uniref:AfsR/SARP family transcriptional regulator n=1 Tax=Streptomyces sp. URMC 129 TaxID=3423407 RepID=UPI003F19594E
MGLGSDKERLVLASLALVVGRPVAIDTLIDRLWENGPPETARSSVHTYVSRIRKSLRSAMTGSDAPLITGHAHTYTLEAAAEAVDWYQYRQMVEEARRLEARGDDVGGSALLRRADRLWQGEALAGLPGSWAGSARVDLAEWRLGATSSRIDMDLRLGRFSELIGELSGLVLQHRNHQTLAGQLMIAYYGDRRPADALRVYREARRVLRATEGLEPDEELARIHQHVLSRAPLRDLVPAASGSGDERSPAPQSNLPRHIALVGREAEMRRLRAAAEAASGKGAVVALEAISGMAGVGKTALAVSAAHQLRDRFPDGQFCIELRAHDLAGHPVSTGAVLATLLRRLGIPPDAIPPDVEERAALGRGVLSSRRAVIILDDVDGPDQIRPLLPTDSRSLFIITSRRRLTGLPGVRSIPLDVLPPGDAKALFRSFAGGERTDDERELAAVVRLLGYLPLALELAANRFGAHPSWSLGTLREQLSLASGRLPEIRDGDSEIAMAFELSYRTLTVAQQTAFRRLGLHPGGEFGPHAAASLIGLPLGPTERLLESLLRCHLLQEPVPHRYRFHDLLGEYAHALAHAEESPEERDAAQERLIEFYLDASARADRVLFPERQPLRLPAPSSRSPVPTFRDPEDAKLWLTTERANLLAVEDRARAGRFPEQAAALSHFLAEFLDADSRWMDTDRMHRHAVEHWERVGNQRGLCLALLALGNTNAATAHYAEAQRTCERAVRVARSIRDIDAEAEALRLLGVTNWHAGRNEESLSLYRRALKLRGISGTPWDRARCQNNIAIALFHTGSYEEARKYFQDATENFELAGDLRFLGRTKNNLGDLYAAMGRTEAARGEYEQSLAIAKETGSLSDLAIVQANLAGILMSSEDAADISSALHVCIDSLETFYQLGDRKNVANALIGIGRAYDALGDFGNATAQYRSALEAARDIGATREETEALRRLGQAEAAAGDLKSAATHLEAALGSARQLRSPGEEAHAGAALAEVRLRQGDREEARLLWHQALGILVSLDDKEAARIRTLLNEI